VIPARRGRPDVSAGNAIATVIYVLLFNLGLIALLTPAAAPSYVRVLDWPVLLGSSAIGAACLIRGRLGRREGGVFVCIGIAVLQASRWLRG
jgi:Ca2+/Na+ antiporter